MYLWLISSENPLGNWKFQYKGRLWGSKFIMWESVRELKVTSNSHTWLSRYTCENPLGNWKLSMNKIFCGISHLGENPLGNWKIMPMLYFSFHNSLTWESVRELKDRYIDDNNILYIPYSENPLGNWKGKGMYQIYLSMLMWESVRELKGMMLL